MDMEKNEKKILAVEQYLNLEKKMLHLQNILQVNAI